MSIPSPFRRVLETGDPDCDPSSKDNATPHLVLVFGDTRKPYLQCFTIEEIERIENKIDRMKAGPRKTELIKIYSTGAETVAVDETGRIVVPSKLRARYGLEGEVFAVASLNTFQIWSADIYRPTDSLEASDLPEDLPDDPQEWFDDIDDEDL